MEQAMTAPVEWMIPSLVARPADADAEHTAVRGYEMRFPPADLCARQARQLTAKHLRHWGLPEELVDNGTLVVSELVTNAVRHGNGYQVGLRVTHSDAELRIEVSDETPVPARLRHVGEWDEHGRGLFLVTAFSRAWGVSPDGTLTWCSIAIPEGRRDGHSDE